MWGDSGCSGPQALKVMGELIGEVEVMGAKMAAVIGPGCSAACTATSNVVDGFNLGTQISYSCTSQYTSQLLCGAP